MGSGKVVNLMFAVGGLLLGWLVCAPTVEWVWGFFDPRPPDLWSHALGLGTGAAATVIAWRHPRVHGLATEVAVELAKITWPTRQETKWATVVVVITVVVASTVLATFDAFHSWWTSKIYGGS